MSVEEKLFVLQRELCKALLKIISHKITKDLTQNKVTTMAKLDATRLRDLRELKKELIGEAKDHWLFNKDKDPDAEALGKYIKLLERLERVLQNEADEWKKE
jgi:hypothetical protein